MNDFYALVKHYYGNSSASTSSSTTNQTSDTSGALNANSASQQAAVKYYRGQGNETATLLPPSAAIVYTITLRMPDTALIATVGRLFRRIPARGLRRLPGRQDAVEVNLVPDSFQ